MVSTRISTLSNVLLVRQRVRAHHADRIRTDDAGREEDLPSLIHQLVDLLRELVRLVLARARLRHDREHGKGETGAGDDVKEIGSCLDQVGKHLSKFNVLADVVLQALDTVRPQHEPDLQAAEAAAERICQSR